jgi:hypothetical protein
MFILLLFYILARGIPWEKVTAQAGQGVQRVERTVVSAGRKAVRHLHEAQRGIERVITRYLR